MKELQRSDIITAKRQITINQSQITTTVSPAGIFQTIIRSLQSIFGNRNKKPIKTPTQPPKEPTKTPSTAATKPAIQTTKPMTPTTKTQPAMKQTLHALLVAIDAYSYPVPTLKGCVNDRDEFKDYLQRQFTNPDEVALNIKTLTDNEATRQGVIDGFSHFKNAKKDDICVFYYSGHGAPSPAPLEFLHLDPDGVSEGIVCFDSRHTTRDLMDKEISYLVAKATEGKDVHFLTLFDCCNSGTITRDAAFTVRTTSASPFPSKFEEYHGHQEYKRETSPNGKVYISPPVGKYLQLSACREQETAKETVINNKSRGVFTYSLIEALEQNGGALSYADLLRILQVRLANKVRDQLPQLITEGRDKNLPFLGGTIPPKPDFLLQFQQDKGKWVMDGGSVQGIPAEGGEITLEDGKKMRLVKVGANTSEVQGMEGRDPKLSYRASVKGLKFKKVKIAFATDTSNDVKRVLNGTFPNIASPFMELVESTTDAQYWIRSAANSFQLTLPGDARPIFKRVEPINQANATLFLNNVEKVAQWRNLLELSNPKSSIRSEEFEIELFRITKPGNLEDSAPEEKVNWQESNVFRYEKLESTGEWQQPAFRLKIRNKGNRTLYFSALNLVDNFGISNRFMPLQELAPKQEAWLLDVFEGNRFKTIPLAIDNEAYASWGINEIKEYFKIIISNDKQLDTTRYNQEGLELDINKAITTRAGREPNQNAKPEELDWTTRDIEMIVVRPMPEQSLAEGQPVEMSKVKIAAPRGLSAKVALTSVDEAERSLSPESSSDQSLSFSDKKEQMRFLPPMTRSADYVAEPFAFTTGRSTSPSLSVLELYDVQGADLVDADNPLEVNLQQSMAANEIVIPMAYDPETKLYIPLGFSDENGMVKIESLPDTTPVRTRSLTGSVKIFFQKVVLSKLGFTYQHPQLSIAQFQPTGEAFTYEANPAKIKAAVANAKNIVVFIHGIIGDTTAMPKILRLIPAQNGQAFQNPYDLVLAFDYENLNTDIRQTAKDLKAKLEAVGLNANHGKQLTIIAHSMGGLVSRWMIEKEGGNQVITRLIQVGTPNGGSPWSDVYQLSTALLTKVVNGAAFFQPYLFALNLLGRFGGQLFKTLQQMDPDDSDFLKELNDGTDPNISYNIIAGNTSLIPKAIQDVQTALLKRVSARFSKQTAFEALNKFLFQEENDIAVSVKNTYKIPGSEKWKNPPTHYEAACDHLSYFGDPAGLEIWAKVVTSRSEL